MRELKLSRKALIVADVADVKIHDFQQLVTNVELLKQLRMKNLFSSCFLKINEVVNDKEVSARGAVGKWSLTERQGLKQWNRLNNVRRGSVFASHQQNFVFDTPQQFAKFQQEYTQLTFEILPINNVLSQFINFVTNRFYFCFI